MRVLRLSLVGLLLSVTVAAQDAKPVSICVVTAEVGGRGVLKAASNPA